jgi:hypothetical protein
MLIGLSCSHRAQQFMDLHQQLHRSGENVHLANATATAERRDRRPQTRPEKVPLLGQVRSAITPASLNSSPPQLFSTNFICRKTGVRTLVARRPWAVRWESHDGGLLKHVTRQRLYETS